MATLSNQFANHFSFSESRNKIVTKKSSDATNVRPWSIVAKTTIRDDMCGVFSGDPLIPWRLTMLQAKDRSVLLPIFLNLQIIKLGCAACQVLPQSLPISLAFSSQAIGLHKIQTSICC